MQLARQLPAIAPLLGFALKGGVTRRESARVNRLTLAEEERMALAGGLEGFEPLQSAGGGGRGVVDGDRTTSLPQTDEEWAAEDGVGRPVFPGGRVIDGMDSQPARIEDEFVAGDAVEVDFGGPLEYLSVKINAQIQV